MTSEEYKAVSYKEALKEIILLTNLLSETVNCVCENDKVPNKVKKSVLSQLTTSLYAIELLHYNVNDIYRGIKSKEES